jgi:hypothetical protein
MKIPDVVGFTLNQALAILGESGFIIHRIKTTNPPRESSPYYDDFSRVIKLISLEENKVELLVCKSSSVNFSL